MYNVLVKSEPNLTTFSRKIPNDSQIIIIERSQCCRNLAHFFKPEYFHFYSISTAAPHPISINPFKIPYGINPQHWLDGIIQIVCRIYELPERCKNMLIQALYDLYAEAEVFPDDKQFNSTYKNQYSDWYGEISKRSMNITFFTVHRYLENWKMSLRIDSEETFSTISMILRYFYCFSCEFTDEHRLFSEVQELSDSSIIGTGISIDELIEKNRGITVLDTSNISQKLNDLVVAILKLYLSLDVLTEMQD